MNGGWGQQPIRSSGLDTRASTDATDLYCIKCRATTPHTYIGRICHGETRTVAVYRCACDTRRPGPWKDTA